MNSGIQLTTAPVEWKPSRPSAQGCWKVRTSTPNAAPAESRLTSAVVTAMTTALVNLLSAGAAFGVLVLTFQHTWAEGLLGFHSTGAVINWIPLFTFAVLFGLSMDYHVFVISRIREAAAERHDDPGCRAARHHPVGRDGDDCRGRPCGVRQI